MCQGLTGLDEVGLGCVLSFTVCNKAVSRERLLAEEMGEGEEECP